MQRKPSNTAISEFTRSLGLLVRRVRAAAATHELSLTESSVMARLDREGSATIAALARAESVRPQSMGSTIAALEERGIVERTPHPTDGRQVNIALTAKGAALRQSAREAKHSWLEQAIAQLSKDEQATLFAAARIIQRLAEQ